MAQYSTRICALCNKIVRDNHIVCAEHMQDYVLFKDEEWFKVLVIAQRKQFEQDIIESVIASGAVNTKKTYIKLTESEKAAIRFLANKKLGMRSISKVLGINRQTIYAYLRRYSKGKQ